MPNAAATVLPWKRLPSVSAQIVRSRISRSPARKADSSIGPACTATTRPSSVRVTVSRQGTGMPGNWHAGELLGAHGGQHTIEDHNQLISRPLEGDSFLSSQGLSARPNRPRAARSGTGEAAWANPD
jgi:hypothetical protein